MFSNIMNYLPSIKETISYIFDHYLGIKLNLSNFSLDNNNNLFIQLTNINIEPNRINHNYLKDINIKLTKGIVEKLEIKLGMNAFEIKISKVSVMLMPVVLLNQNKKGNKEKIEIKEKIQEISENDDNNINNDNNKKGFFTSFVEYYLSKLKIYVGEIELITFNYEIINKNLAYSNPVLSFYIHNIRYDNGEIEEENNKSYIRKNIWENKHFSIGNICLKISKSYQNEDKNKLNENEKDAISIRGETKKNEINFDKDNNDNILLINAEKGIHFYTNINNEIQGELGDIQLVINLFQLELLKNFIDTYLLYLTKENSNNNLSESQKQLDLNKSKLNKSINKSVINSSSVIAPSNNQIMSLKIKLNSFSIILLEKDQYSTESKFYEFNKDKMTEHFCYFEYNFFIFILSNLCFHFDNKKKLISLTIDDIGLNYIEYSSKTKKEEEIELIARTGSEYSECSDNIILKNNEVFQSMSDNIFNVKEYYCSYDYKYNKNQIILIKNINLGYNFSMEEKKKVNFDLNSFNVNFHPILLFKLLKILYENTSLIKEVLFYNYQINKKNKEKEKISLEKSSDSEEIFNSNSLKNSTKKGTQNNDKLKLSLLSCEEEEIGDTQKSNKIDNNDINNLEEEKIYSSDIIFQNAKSKEPKEKINEKIKAILKSLSIEIKIKTFEIRVYSFKCEENFSSIINPFFNEFYYDHIYIMDIKEDFGQKKLKINEVTSSDYFNIIIKYLSLKNEKNKNGQEELLLKFHSIISSFTNNKIFDILSDTFPAIYNLDENKILVDLKFNFYFKVKLLPYMLSFVNIWKYTLLIFDIFQQRMIYNYNKGKNELLQMNFEDSILKHFKKLKSKKKIIDIENSGDIILEDEDDYKTKIEVKIKSINIYFDIIPKKIKSSILIKDIKLNLEIDENKQSINFTINKIESNEFKLFVGEIKLNLNITKINNKNSQDLKISLKNSIQSNNGKNNIILKSALVFPQQSMEIYIQNMIKLKKRKQQIASSQKKPNNNLLTKLEINITLKDIQLEVLESILYINDIYNVILKEEIYNNNNINSKKQALLNRSDTSSSQILSKSSSSDKDNDIDLLIEENKISENKNPKNSKDLLVNINFNLSSIKCFINDEKNHRSTELNIKNISFKNNNLNLEIIEFLIFYEIKDFGDKVKINLGKISNINLRIIEKINSKNSFHISLDEIFFTFCKDSLSYLENILDEVSNLLSKCFVKTKKTNKIVIAKKENKLIETYDIDESQNGQESELFGNNVARSICLVSENNKFILDIDEDYLDNLKNEKEELNESIDEIYKSKLRIERMKDDNESELILIINNIRLGLYSGFDFESTEDVKTESINYENKENEEKEEKENNINENYNDFNEKLKNLQSNIENSENNEIEENFNIDEYRKSKIKQTDSFEVIELNPYKKVGARQKNNYLLFKIDNISLSILYEKKNSYEVEFTIDDFEIIDSLKESSFKRLLSARKNIGLSEDKKNIPFLSVFVDISNSQNELSTNNYKDFNITCEISFCTFHIMIHQNSLIFILNYLINNDAKKNIKDKDNNSSSQFQLYNKEQYHTEPSYVIDSIFNQIVVEDYGEEQNDLIEDKNFIFITKFLFREFELHITYESSDLGFSFQNIYIPLIPNLKDYPFSFSRITYRGFVTINQFTDFFVDHFLGQLSKYNIVYNLLNSISWTQPFFNIAADFFDIFISPFQYYRKNKGFMQGLFKGLKKFFFNLLSKNVYVGEKMFRTLTTFIGVTKNNNIGKNSFYEKYILTDEKKKIYDYFYK